MVLVKEERTESDRVMSEVDEAEPEIEVQSIAVEVAGAPFLASFASDEASASETSIYKEPDT